MDGNLSVKHPHVLKYENHYRLYSQIADVL